MPYTPTFINKYGWIWGIITTVFFAGMVGAGVLHGETQSVTNADDIVQLKIDMAVVKDEVHHIAIYIGAEKK